MSLVLFGTKDGKSVDSGSHKLDNSANNFEKGATDMFNIKCKDLGDLTRVTVSNNASDSWQSLCSYVHDAVCTSVISACMAGCCTQSRRSVYDPMTINNVTGT